MKNKQAELEGSKRKSQHSRLRITVKKPSATRRSFSLMKDEIHNQTRSQTAIKSPELDTINERLKSGELAIDTAHMLVLELKDRLHLKYQGTDHNKNKSINKDNELLANKILDEASYKNIKQLSLYNVKVDVKRIVEMLGEKSIRTITKVELKGLVDRLDYSISVKNKLVCRLNAVLAKAGRDFKISKYKSKKSDISHITESELKKLLRCVDVVHAKNPQLVTDAIIVLFYTGMREGELFAANKKGYKASERTYKVDVAFNRDGNEKDEPKTGKVRMIAIPKVAIESFERWLGYSKDVRKSYRLRLSKIITRVAAKAFPQDQDKHISCHDLRHSFAIWSLGKGLSLTQVAFLLGNTLAVCQAHYTGYILNDEAMSAISKRLG